MNDKNTVDDFADEITELFDLKAQFLELFKDEAIAMRDDLVGAADKVADYSVEQATELAALVGQPGFAKAVRAARDNVLLKSGLRLTAQADASDARFVGLVHGALSLGARALSSGLV